MADKTIAYSRSIVTQKKFVEGESTAYITQLSKPIILKGVSTKTCENVLYSIDGIHFTNENTINDDNVLSMAIVPFQLGGEVIGLPADMGTSGDRKRSLFYEACEYILAGRSIDEDINIDNPISKVKHSSEYHGNGAYRYLLQYLEKNKDDIVWDTGDLFSELDAHKQDTFGGSDFITDNISVKRSENAQQLSISSQPDANGLILKPAIELGDISTSDTIIIKQSPYFFLYPEGCPAPDGDPDKLIIDNFWRGGGLLVSNKSLIEDRIILTLYIFAVT